jgi:hypothetical protein
MASSLKKSADHLLPSQCLLITRFDTQDGLFDLAWSESHENHIVVASGDGSIKMFDIALKVCFTQSPLVR